MSNELEERNMKKEAQIIALANQKGGVGKTTTCHVLAYGLADQGCKVLTIDTDPQCNLTESFRLNGDMEGTVYQLFRREKKVEDCICRINANINLLPGSLSMAGADMEFSFAGREYLLKEALEPIKEEYDFILVDTPPTLGIITINTLAAADGIVIPVKASKYSVQGLSQLLQTIRLVQGYYNKGLAITGVLVTQHEGRSNIRKGIKAALDKLMDTQGIRVFDSVIRNGVAIEEAQYWQTNPLTERPKASVTEDYRAFVTEFLQNI